MATENLSIQLTADITNFRANLTAAAAEVNRTGQAAQTASAQISQNIARVNSINLSGFNRALQQGAVSLSSIATVSTSASRGLAQVAAASASTGRAIAQSTEAVRRSQTNYMNFGRVIQDLPFGLIGIQNNLTQLIPSVGAWGLAFSALISGLTFAQTGLSNWTRGIDGNKKATEAVKDATDEYVKSLDDVSKAQLTGAMNAQKDMVGLESLYKIATDVSIATKTRKEAVNELQEIYPAYFKNLSDEAILNGSAQKSYEKLAASIISTAKARAAEDLIAENSKRAQAIRDEQKRDLELQIKLEKERKDERSKANSVLDLTLSKDTELLTLYEKQKKNREELTDINKRNGQLSDDIIKQVKAGADLFGGIGDEKAVKGVKSLADILKELGKNLEKTEVQLNSTFGERNEAQIKAYQTAIDSATDSFGKQSKAVQDLIAQQRKLFQLPSIADGSTNVGGLAPKNTAKVTGKQDTTFGVNMSEASFELLKEQARIIELTEKFNKDFGELAQSGIANGLGNMANAIGEAFASGESVIGAIGNSLLTTFSGFLSDFGDLLIQYGAAAVLKGKLDLAVAIPGAGIFAGLAAIAAGVALKVAAGAIGSFSSGKSSGATTSNFNDNPTPMANGGVVFGPTNALVGEYSGARNNPEVVAPLNKLKGMLGNTGNNIQVIPIANRRELAIMVREGNEELSRR